MKHNIIAAAILAVALVIAAFLHAGRYYLVAVGNGSAVRIDRWTGKTKSIDTAKNGDWDFVTGSNSN